MRYFNTVTKEYPRHIGDLQLIYGNIDESQIPEEWVSVELDAEPEIGKYQYLEAKEPEHSGTQWIQGWIVRDMNAEQRAHVDQRESEKNELGKVRPIGS